jgi:hypothetical protein
MHLWHPSTFRDRGECLFILVRLGLMRGFKFRHIRAHIPNLLFVTLRTALAGDLRAPALVGSISMEYNERKAVNEKTFHPSRFLVRQGCKGWMVYDRQRKGPAMVGTYPATDLTREEADKIERRLSAESERN